MKCKCGFVEKRKGYDKRALRWLCSGIYSCMACDVILSR